MDYDLISNISVPFESDDENSQTTWIIFPHEIAHAIISFMSLCAHGLVIFTIMKNKSMRTSTNMFLLNVIVLDALYIIISPGNILLVLHNISTMEIYFISYDIETTLQSGTCLLLILFSLNYCIRPKRYLFFVSGTWIITMLLCIMFVALNALYKRTHTALYIVLFNFTLLILVNITCRIAFWKKIDICPFRLNIVTLYVSSWLLSWICCAIWIFSNDYNPIVHRISDICAAIGYGYGIFNIFALAYFDKKFKMRLIQTIKCKKYVYDHPEDEYVIDIPADQDHTSHDLQESTVI